MDLQQPQPGAKTQADQLSRGRWLSLRKVWEGVRKSITGVGEAGFGVERWTTERYTRDSATLCFILQTANTSNQVGKHFQVSLLVVIVRRQGELLAFSQFAKQLQECLQTGAKTTPKLSSV